MITLIFKLLCGHALADFALQSDFMAKNKNRHNIPMGYDPKLHGPMLTIWPYVLTSHALIHGLMVYLATGEIIFGLLETMIHWAIDFGKCDKLYGIHTDQAMHIGSKLLYALIIYITNRGSLL